MKLESTNVTLIVKNLKRDANKIFTVAREHLEELRDLINDYLEMEKKGKLIVTKFILKYNGIDRIDSTKGYVENNVLPCCKNCNTAKNILTRTQFKEFIKKVYEYWASK